MPQDRAAVPAAVARRLRQEAGFGCCKCGLPIYQYHHIDAYTQADPHFRPEDMMILCPTDHHEATVNAMREDEQRKYKAEPRNIAAGYVEGLLKINQSFAGVSVGSVQFVGDGWVVRVDGEDLLSIGLDEHGRLLLSLALYDQDDALLAVINKNEWISGDPLPWDIESKFQQLTVRKKPGQVVLSVNARGELLEVRADLWRNGQNVKLTDRAIEVNPARVELQDLCLVAMGLNIKTRQTGTQLELIDPDVGAAFIVSWPNPSERVRRGRVAWLALKLGTTPDVLERSGRNDPCPCRSGAKFKRCHLGAMP